MDSIDLQVLKDAKRWLDAGFGVTLVTVTRTWGSSPRPIGAMLALRDDGRVSGSVSGGCIEDDLIYRGRAAQPTGSTPEVITYGVNAEEARRMGLPCGGTIQLVMEPLRDAVMIGRMLELAGQRMLFAREVDIANGTTTFRPAAPTAALLFDGGRLVTVHGPRYRLLLIGAGALSAFVAQIALALDYQVIVCDPREEYSSEWSVAGAELVRTMPDDTVLAMRPDARTAVIALTHDPKLDDLALMEALKSDAFYVGAIGSRANNRARRERLREFDVTAEELARLHGPVGTYIGSRTPHEIAISILAELTAAKNGVRLPEGLEIVASKAGLGSQVCSGTLQPPSSQREFASNHANKVAAV
ncbi:XdhC family protein [Cupriavidus necator]|uniref:Xanthine dehydrogenase accessory factor n=1 Tax=Cupriavidus pinatubonensis (strain JMP 134 / LMG 1197) TaxID=264198 RepID=Q46M95_CUPPJ|nr:XdhC family protein [Cupriavidus necator]